MFSARKTLASANTMTRGTNFLKRLRFKLPLEKEQNSMIRQNTQSDVWPI